jgi:hypothetical protein
MLFFEISCRLFRTKNTTDVLYFLTAYIIFLSADLQTPRRGSVVNEILF